LATGAFYGISGEFGGPSSSTGTWRGNMGLDTARVVPTGAENSGRTASSIKWRRVA